ncbi:patatin [Luteibacter pinisoli]|uniref:Patatin n=1 Tax=Luteibacter pinisoli TaxID=2589080 RepID=A0A4Y5Z1K3_9GAMM|nr:patatin-like phospholipase family protein [Luteibacter pinisoli]QDE39190.1 patatin [Luteibacter pinisoli]
MPATELPLSRPRESPPCRAGTFELGLTLAGAVSGGAYAAGVLDFFYEALEHWYDARAKGHAVPTHDILLRVISGASAGSLNGVLSAVALPYRFPHVHAGPQPAGMTGNPFYDAWVKRIDARELLGKADLADPTQPIASLLDSTSLDVIARDVLAYSQAPTTRPYIANPLKCVFTVTNLRGVPYMVLFKGNPEIPGHGMMAHADWLRFAVDTGHNPYERGWAYPDERRVAGPNHPQRKDWQGFMDAALASAAFPAGLRYREVARPWRDYDQRVVIVPGQQGQAEPVAIPPAWANGEDSHGEYRFVAVDGGAMDNEPFELARTELAGTLGRNPREGDKVNRIVIMLDPFPEAETPGPSEAASTNLIESMAALFGAWKQQARFKPEEVALALDATVYSRFMIAPSRPATSAGARWIGGRALAAGALGGFSGFLAEAYRHHDFLLGRRNCQRFLAERLLVPASNPIFAGWASDPALAGYLRTVDGEVFAPVIPLVGGCEGLREALPAWPKGAFKVETLMPLVEGRMQALYRAATANIGARFATWLAWHLYVRRLLLRIVSGRLRRALASFDLL